MKLKKKDVVDEEEDVDEESEEDTEEENEEEEKQPVKIKKEITKEKNILVVPELPKQDVRNVIGEDSKEYELRTITEALTEIYNDIKELKKSLI